MQPLQLFSITGGVIMLLVFVAGWLVGLASRSGGRKWRERYAAERDAHAAYRRDADAAVAAANARAKEVEREHARLAAAAPVTAATVTPAAGASSVVTAAPRPGETVVIRPGQPVEERR
ncbi:hypothetical protein [Sphingomonas sp.]|uniref:hypothetical protein n=1 Tax=Sphingomonas sp. TaxID=28214 RepID=UPI003CC63B2A